MAFSFNHKVMIFLLAVNGYFLLTTSASPTPLEMVCDKSRDIEFCLNVFGSDPATRTASLPELGKLAIDKATDKATRTKADINARLFYATDPKLKNVLTRCVAAYDDALHALRVAPFELKRGEYMYLYRHANEAGRGAAACEQAFIDHSLPSPLTRANVQLGDYCSIIAVIANSSY